jgi:hypothetical protein
MVLIPPDELESLVARQPEEMPRRLTAQWTFAKDVVHGV